MKGLIVIHIGMEYIDLTKHSLSCVEANTRFIRKIAEEVGRYVTSS